MTPVDHKVPRARTEGLVIQEMPAGPGLPYEVLVYDLDRHEAHCLNETAARVWQHCDGASTVGEVARRLGQALCAPVDERVVWYALGQLERFRLLQDRVALPADLARISRRELVRRLGLAAAVAVPLIISVAAPPPAAAASGCLGPGAICSANNQCCSNLCNSGICA
ncbi:MAG: PqqD family protein [Ardenticatenaceae bacterium]|nr:PqqD family protein [Ardenticatenaceae bacterium]